MQIELHRGSGKGEGGKPLYRQIAAAIRNRIEAGDLSPGARLPAIRELASQLAVNRNTVSLAYEALAAGGVFLTALRGGSGIAPGARWVDETILGKTLNCLWRAAARARWRPAA